jgi:hypothetical protein
LRDWRNQPVPTLANRLDTRRSRRIILKSAPQLADGAVQNVVGHEHVRPDGGDERLAGHDVARTLGEADEHLHHLGLEPGYSLPARKAVERRLHQPAGDNEFPIHLP